MSRHRARPRPRSRAPILIAATAFVATILSIGSATVLGLYALAESSRTTIADATGDGSFEITGTCAAESCTYLLLGSDSREGLSEADQARFGDDALFGGSNRSDTIILVRTEPDAKRATFLSFPRDLWVTIPEHGEDRINTAFEGGIEGGGAQLVAATITDLTGIPVDHVLYVNLAGFQRVVDALGGVRLCLPEPMTDRLTRLDLPAGCQTLDGADSLAYVRTRHQPCDRIPDFARIARQQQFLRAVITEMLRPSEVLQLPRLIPQVLGNLVVNDGLNPAELAYLAGRLRGVSAGNVDFRVVPTFPAWVGDKDVLKATEPEAMELFRRMRMGLPLGDLGRISLRSTPPSPAVVGVAVAAADAAIGEGPDRALRLLTDSGFDTSASILESFDASVLLKDVPRNGALVLFDPDAPLGEISARVVRRFLRTGTVLAAPPGSIPAGADVIVVAGSDFRQGPLSAANGCP